jgi:hypothetical protein
MAQMVDAGFFALSNDFLCVASGKYEFEMSVLR